MDWYRHVKKIRKHLVRIETPGGGGTGFLISRSNDRFGIATAAHVVRDARAWEQRIILHHDDCKEACTLWPNDRDVRLHTMLDSAYVAGTLPAAWIDVIPVEPVQHVPFEKTALPGVEVGWLGYPGMAGWQLFFFGGHVSVYSEGRYFIDGIALPGVSGGPAFCLNADGELRILGSVSAYTKGQEHFPGMMVADDCTQWPDLIKGEDE